VLCPDWKIHQKLFPQAEADPEIFPNCNDIEYGTRCDGSEDENSWTDEEESGN
jgi:hypothetical protein